MSDGTSTGSNERELPSTREDVARQLEQVWDALEAAQAKVSRVPLDWPVELLVAKLSHEQRRLRAIWERP